MRIPENAKCTTSHAQAPAPRPTVLASQAEASARPGDSVTRVQTPTNTWHRSENRHQRGCAEASVSGFTVSTSKHLFMGRISGAGSISGSCLWIPGASRSYQSCLALWVPGCISRSCVLMQQVLGVPWPPSDFTTAVAENSIHLRAPHLN